MTWRVPVKTVFARSVCFTDTALVSLIATFESGNTPLSVKQVQAYIKTIFEQDAHRQQN